jgi:hypothetical protein
MARKSHSSNLYCGDQPKNQGKKLRKLIITPFFLMYIIALTPILCQAGVSNDGKDPFTPVASSCMTTPVSALPDAKSLITEPMTSGNSSGAAFSSPSTRAGYLLENITSNDLDNRINLISSDLVSAAGAVIIPLAILSVLVNCLALLLGSLIGWEAAKIFGLGGLIMAFAGLLVYYGYPLIIGLIRILAGCL